jgi:hypothetical protein
MSSGKKKGLCSDVIESGSDRFSLSMVETVAASNIQRELVLSFGIKLPKEEVKCSGQYKGDLYCLVRELDFWR